MVLNLGIVKGLVTKCKKEVSRMTDLEPRKMVVLKVYRGHVVLVWGGTGK